MSIMAKRYLTSKELPFESLYPKRTDGKCRKCESTLSGRRTQWCSDECAKEATNEFFFRCGNVTTIRNRVYDRDKGICVECGVDASRMSDPVTWNSWWHADHITEIADGGDHTLENLQTLCVPCHKAKTKASASTRRRPEMQEAFAA